MYTRISKFLTNQRQLVWALRAAVIFILVTLILGISMPAIERQLTAWKLLPEPQSLTELYFTDPNQLPAHYEPNKSLVTKFSIVNHDQPSGSYRYTITESNVELTDTKTVESGSVRILRNNRVNLAKAVVLVEMGSQVYISVAVNNVTIGYWITQD